MKNGQRKISDKIESQSLFVTRLFHDFFLKIGTPLEKYSFMLFLKIFAENLRP